MRYYIYDTTQRVAVVDEEKGLYRLGRFDIVDRQPDWKGYWLSEWIDANFTTSNWTEVSRCRGRKLLKQGGLEL